LRADFTCAQDRGGQTATGRRRPITPARALRSRRARQRALSAPGPRTGSGIDGARGPRDAGSARAPDGSTSRAAAHHPTRCGVFLAPRDRRGVGMPIRARPGALAYRTKVVKVSGIVSDTPSSSAPPVASHAGVSHVETLTHPGTAEVIMGVIAAPVGAANRAVVWPPERGIGSRPTRAWLPIGRLNRT
jgi:hypothetical protein